MNRFREYDLVFAGYATRFPKLTMERDNGVLVLRLPRRTAGRSVVRVGSPSAAGGYRLIASDPDNGVVIVIVT